MFYALHFNIVSALSDKLSNAPRTSVEVLRWAPQLTWGLQHPVSLHRVTHPVSTAQKVGWEVPGVGMGARAVENIKISIP
jgi:hypothetical protein